MSDFSIGDMITKHQELRAIVDAEETRLKEQLKPYRDAMNAINVAIGVELQAQKLQNFKSDDGTAYLRHDLGVKVDNAPDFLQFVRTTESWGMLDVRALKEPVVNYASEHQDAPPPGISFAPSVTCIIRR